MQKTQAKNSKSRHFLKRCLPEMRPKRKPDIPITEFDIVGMSMIHDVSIEYVLSE